MLIHSLTPLASRFQLIDYPDTRKVHIGNIPIIGGICIYITLIASLFLSELLFSMTVDSPIKWLLGTGGILMITGIIDDMRTLPATYRLYIQIIVTSLMYFGSNIHIRTLAYMPSEYILTSSILEYPLTIFAVVGITNAFNFMDGIDGLTGNLTNITLLMIISIIALLHKDVMHFQAISILMGSIFGYLLINLSLISKHKVFLGDAGSTLLGYIVAWTVIYYSQLPKESALPPSLTLWLLTLPVIDTLTVIYRRISKKQNIFHSDRQHLHHIFMRSGFNTTQTLFALCIFSFSCALIGFIIYLLVGDLLTTVLFILLPIAYHTIIIKHAVKFSQFLRNKFK